MQMECFKIAGITGSQFDNYIHTHPHKYLHKKKGPVHAAILTVVMYL